MVMNSIKVSFRCFFSYVVQPLTLLNLMEEMMVVVVAVESSVQIRWEDDFVVGMVVVDHSLGNVVVDDAMTT